MIGSAKAHYEGIKAFSETDQTEDLKSITLPVLVMQGDDDQVVPYKNAAILQDKLLPNSQLIIYPGFPHGMHTSRRYHQRRSAGVYPRLIFLSPGRKPLMAFRQRPGRQSPGRAG
jgi:non-heme chloroperoxidase